MKYEVGPRKNLYNGAVRTSLSLPPLLFFFFSTNHPVLFFAICESNLELDRLLFTFPQPGNVA